MSQWLTLSPFAPAVLQETIHSLHHAAQFLASTAESLLPHKADDSHTNLGWDSQKNALVSHPLANRFQLALEYSNFSIAIWEENLVKSRFPLAEHNQQQVYDWLQTTFTKLGLDGSNISAIDRYAIPKHIVQEGQPFVSLSEEILRELANRRNNAQEFFVSIAPEYPYASPIRTWPHHFDTGVYIPIRRNETHQDLNSIGLGMAVPDGSANDMYFYVNHWSKQHLQMPNPLPALAGGGQWITEGWTGAVLPLQVVTASAKPHDQQEIVQTFFDSAIKATLSLIGENDRYAKVYRS